MGSRVERTMSLKTEEHEQFKICGLCSQLVDESVLINSTLKTFFVEFLNIEENALPDKTCLECYKSAIECKRFKEACRKSVNKLLQKNVSSSMILGKSKTAISSSKGKSKDVVSNAMESLKKATQPSEKKKILESLGLDPDKIEIGVGGRSSRSQTTPAATPTSARSSRGRAAPIDNIPNGVVSAKKPAKKGSKSGGGGSPKCHVIIKKEDIDRANQYLGQLGLGYQINSEDTPLKRPGQKRGRMSNDAVAPPSAAKKSRKSVKIEPPEPVISTPAKASSKKQPTPTKAAAKQPAPTKASSKPVKASPDSGASRSSFGRVRNTPTKSGYVYGDDLETAPDLIEIEPSPPPPPPSPGKRGQTPKSTGKKPMPASKQKKVVEEVVEIEPDDDEDVEEVFPTIGPYQCEICQIITDTKVEFVEHIEGKHADVVDEEVLLSLKSGIRKSNKKNGVQAATPAPKPAPAPKKTPSPPKKAAAAVKKTPVPAKAVAAPSSAAAAKSDKKRPGRPPMGPASRQNKPSAPASPAKAPGNSPTKNHSWLCDTCDTIIPRSSASEIARQRYQQMSSGKEEKRGRKNCSS